MKTKPVNNYGFISLDDEEDIENEGNKDNEEIDAFGFQPFEDEESEVDTNMDQQKDDTDLLQEEEQIPEQEEITPEKEPSFWQSVADNPLTQSILGAAKRVTYPLDILKMAVMGEGFSGLEELEEAAKKEGIPFDREKYIETVFDIGSRLPTQQLAENLVKEKTGVDLAPKDTFSKIIRTGTEIASTGPSGLLKQPAKEIGKQVLKRTAGGLGGAAAGEGLKEVGVPEPLADMLAYTLGGAAGGSKQPATLNKGQAKNLAVAEEHGLRKFGGMQRENPLENAIASPKKLNKAVLDLEESSKKAIDKLIENKIPISKQKAMGLDLEEVYTKAYDETLKKSIALDKANASAKSAGKKTNEINLKPVLDNIKKKIKDIRGTAPSLSPSDKSAIRELKKQYRQLSKKPKQPPLLYGPNGQPINQVPKGRVAKEATAEQLLDQYKNFNEETKGIYKKPEFTGSEEVVKNVYGELKNDLIDAIDKSSPEIAKDLRFANKVFHENSKLEDVTDLISKAFEDGYDPKKLNQILGGKRNRAFLERDLGKDVVKEMQNIAKYGMDAEKQVLKAVKNPKTLGELASELTPLKASLLFVKGTAGLPFVIAHDIPKALVNRAKGYLMLSPTTRQSYSDYLKHAISPESAAFKKASKELTKAIEDEWGSEKEFLEMINDEEDEE